MTRHLGVLIGRFQIHSLTDGHQYLFAQVASRCTRVLALLGVPPVLGTRRDPLDYALRARMLQDYWTYAYPNGPELTVLPSIDCPTNEEWARRADQMIDAVAPNQPATIYCGPDGCGPIYTAAKGKWPHEIIDSIPGHATAVRASVQPRHSEDFRAGVIYQSQRGFLNPFPVIDVAICAGDRVLLAQKVQDRDRWRLIGGFVDGADVSLEAAVKREAHEETGLEIGNIRYAGSAVIDDWRYRSTPESMLSAVFVADKLWGDAKAMDDIVHASWWPQKEVAQLIHPNHADLWAHVVRLREKEAAMAPV